MMKYKLTEETLEFNGRTLHRIEALKNFDVVRIGDKGGWIESENNLSQAGNAWVFNNAKVYGEAAVFGNARVSDSAEVFDSAEVKGNTWVYDNAKVYGEAVVFGHAHVFDRVKICGNVGVYGCAEVKGDAIIENNRDYIVFKNWWSSGRYFTWTRSNNKWKVGCFYGTGKELIKRAYTDSENSGKMYKKVVEYVESILSDENKKNMNIFKRILTFFNIKNFFS